MYVPEICALLECYEVYSAKDRWTLEDGTDRLLRNVGTELPLCAASDSKTAQI